jgi:actin-related protein 8
MNDRERVEWTQVVKPTQPIKGFGSGGLGVLPNSPPLVSCSKPFYIGDEALNIPSFSSEPTSLNYPKFSLLYPIRNGQPNMLHYPSLQAVKDDLECIWHYSLLKVCPKQAWKQRNIVLVLPDTATHGYIQMAASILLSTFGFANLSIVSESVATTMATGWSAATVVDIGASTTTVACVEDGLIVPSTVKTVRVFYENLIN